MHWPLFVGRINALTFFFSFIWFFFRAIINPFTHTLYSFRVNRPTPPVASIKLKFITNWMRQRLDKCVGRSFSFVSGSVGRALFIVLYISYWWFDSNINIMSNVGLKQSEPHEFVQHKKRQQRRRNGKKNESEKNSVVQIRIVAMHVERRTAQMTFGMAKARSERIKTKM